MESYVDYSYLDEEFKTLSELKYEHCFGDIYRRKEGKYISYDLSVMATPDNRKFYREMIAFWMPFLEKANKELPDSIHIIMDMEKHSLSLIVSVFTCFRLLRENPHMVEYYCKLRRKYRKLPVSTAMLLCQAAEYPENQEHCNIPYSGLTSETLPELFSFNFDGLLVRFKNQPPMKEKGDIRIFDTWGYKRNWYNRVNFSDRQEQIESLIVKLLYKGNRK